MAKKISQAKGVGGGSSRVSGWTQGTGGSMGSDETEEAGRAVPQEPCIHAKKPRFFFSCSWLVLKWQFCSPCSWGQLSMSTDILGCQNWRWWWRCYWYPLSRERGGCQTSHNDREVPYSKEGAGPKCYWCQSWETPVQMIGESLKTV